MVDAACLCVFVVLGRESHGIDAGPAWFLDVVWPFLAGWFAVAIATRLYTSPRIRRGLAVTGIVGIALALVLRGLVTHRATPAAFVMVAYGFLLVATFGWRVLQAAVSRRARR